MNETQQLLAQKTELEQQVQLADLARKLETVPAFKKLILEHYFINETVRNVSISADPGLSESQRADALAMAQASGHLRRFLQAQIAMGDQCKKVISEIDDALEDLRREGADEAGQE